MTVDEVVVGGDVVAITSRTTTTTASCPTCGPDAAIRGRGRHGRGRSGGRRILGVVSWMHAHNERHPHDQVCFARLPEPSRPAQQVRENLEERLADDVIWWHERSGHKIVYWGGIAHTGGPQHDDSMIGPEGVPAAQVGPFSQD
ncbi:hypothetical protein AB0J63_45535 [Streptosporangium canum]|uniref:hypothetical protein n=1 Tax=Streptosporangium canum TaxID=324952 RepID=UPI003447614B